MTSGPPWSVKGIDPKAREAAKDLARRSGMTLGEWLNQVILEDTAAEEALPRPQPIDRRPVSPVYRRVEAPEQVDAVIEKAMSLNDAPVVIDFVVHRDAMVWPMVAAGTSNDDITTARSLAPVWDREG